MDEERTKQANENNHNLHHHLELGVGNHADLTCLTVDGERHTVPPVDRPMVLGRREWDSRDRMSQSFSITIVERASACPQNAVGPFWDSEMEPSRVDPMYTVVRFATSTHEIGQGNKTMTRIATGKEMTAYYRQAMVWRRQPCS